MNTCDKEDFWTSKVLKQTSVSQKNFQIIYVEEVFIIHGNIMQDIQE